MKRACDIDGCERPHRAKGYCRTHYGEHIEGRQPRAEFTPAARLEDIRFMADTGECLDGVAQRIGITVRGVQIFLTRHNERDLLATLTKRNPRDINNRTNIALLDWLEPTRSAG